VIVRARTPLRPELVGIVCILTVRSFTGTTFAVHNGWLAGLMLIAVVASVTSRVRRAEPRSFGAIVSARGQAASFDDGAYEVV